MNIFDMKVHPAADEFPMLSEIDLLELANDISENGLIHPVVIKGGVLIDGRNRRAACKIVGVVPETIELNGQDPISFIWSSNVLRRQMTTGQLAMMYAVLFPEAENTGVTDPSRPEQVGRTNLSRARFIITNANHLVDSVKAGSITLNSAHSEAEKLKKKADEHIAKLALIKSDAKLNKQVAEEELSVDEAFEVFKKRNEKKFADIDSMNSSLKDLLRTAKFILIDDNAVSRLSGLINKYKNDFDHSDVADIKSAMKIVADFSGALTQLTEEVK